MIVLKENIPAQFGLDGLKGETKEFGATTEAMLIQSGVAVAYTPEKTETKKTKTTDKK